MSSQATESTRLIDFLAWVEVNKKKLLIGAAVVAVAIAAYSIYQWHRNEAEAEASAAFYRVQTPASPTEKPGGPAADWHGLHASFHGARSRRGLRDWCIARRIGRRHYRPRHRSRVRLGRQRRRSPRTAHRVRTGDMERRSRLHAPDPRTPLSTSVRALAALKRRGLHRGPLSLGAHESHEDVDRADHVRHSIHRSPITDRPMRCRGAVTARPVTLPPRQPVVGSRRHFDARC